MELSPQFSSEDALLGSDEGILYNNAVAQDERMGSGSDNDSESEDEPLLGDQPVDYSQLERVLVGGSYGRSGSLRSGSRGGGSSQLHNVGTQSGSRRSVGQVRLFTTAAGRTGIRGMGRMRAGRGGRSSLVPESMAVEDITAVGT